MENYRGDFYPKSSTTEYSDHDNRPIALRKRVRSCMQYPICNVVSYDHLSPVYRAFVSNLDQVHILTNIKEAIWIPVWKAAAFDEVRVLEKYNIWQIT